VLGFSVLSATEPTIANNQLSVAQARSLAESGVEQAIWALNRWIEDPTDPKGIPASAPLPVSWTGAAPYDGSQLIPVSTGGNNVGGFKVTVAKGLSSAQLIITSEGWVPNDTSAKAHQRIKVTVFNPQYAFRDPPAALSVRGELQAGGNGLIDSRADQSCGKKMGTMTKGATSFTGTASDIWGATDTSSPLTSNDITDAGGGAIPANSQDGVKNVSASAFDQSILTDDDINALRAYAKAHGTYLQGTVSFDTGNKIPNGLVFIDTTTGTNITQEGVSPPTPPSQFANVEIHGNPAADPSGIFSGYLFVNGTLSIDGNFLVHGMIYAQNDISYHGVGAGGVYGAMMSRNIKDLSSTTIDSDLLGNALINYNCAYAKTGGGAFPNKWSLEKGTYKELCDSCI
jgi:hypothetical protein